jgi:hypothetical protein
MRQIREEQWMCMSFLAFSQGPFEEKESMQMAIFETSVVADQSNSIPPPFQQHPHSHPLTVSTEREREKERE